MFMRASIVLCFVLVRNSASLAFYTEDGPVTILTEKNFKELVLDSNEVWMVEFYAPWCGHCKAMKDEWIKAAGAMGGIVHFGAVDSTVEQSLASRYEVKGYPTVKVFSPLNKEPTDYQNAREAKPFCKAAFAAAKALTSSRLNGKTESNYKGNKKTTEEAKPEIPKKEEVPVKPVEVVEIVNKEGFDTACMETTCLLLFVPNIRDAGKEKREEMIAVMKSVGDVQARGLFQYGWIEGGSQMEMEEKLHMGFGYPAVVAISGNKGRYATYTGSFSEHNINVFVKGLQLGSVRTKVLPELPAFSTVEPWDGEDAPAIEEPDYDLEDEI